MKNRIVAGCLTSILLAGTSSVALAGNEATMDEKAEIKADHYQMTINDAWIDGKLETALLFNEHLNSFTIDTEVKAGVAYLTGSVESDIDRDLAGEIAESIDGVKEVQNELIVDKDGATASSSEDDAKVRNRFKQRVDNATTTARIKTELLLNGNTAGLSIDVDSFDDRIVLTGVVDSEKEADLAEQIARNESGTREVENHLTIESDS